MDSHDIGPFDSGVFHFQDDEGQGGKRGIGPEKPIVTSSTSLVVILRATARKDRQKDNPLDATGQII
jgi:hypothetical protein